jgi:excisionase family DNA binding protein
MTHEPTPKLSITIREAAHSSGFSESYLRVLISRGTLAHLRIGRAVRVLVSDLESFLKGHRHTAKRVGTTAQRKDGASSR